MPVLTRNKDPNKAFYLQVASIGYWDPPTRTSANIPRLSYTPGLLASATPVLGLHVCITSAVADFSQVPPNPSHLTSLLPSPFPSSIFSPAYPFSFFLFCFSSFLSLSISLHPLTEVKYEPPFAYVRRDFPSKAMRDLGVTSVVGGFPSKHMSLGFIAPSLKHQRIGHESKHKQKILNMSQLFNQQCDS